MHFTFSKISKVSVVLTLGILLLPWLARPVAAQSATRDNKKPTATKRPAPPRRIPPNKVKPGGGLDFSYRACEDRESSLTALVPIDNPVLTTQPYPSFLFYVPDRGEAIEYGEFSLFVASEKTRVYSTKIAIENTPGIIKIDLPHVPQHALEPEQPYHWYFKVYCQTQADAPIFLDVDGWVERVAITATTEAQIDSATPDIWYDAIAKTAQGLLVNPQDPNLKARWLRLLQFIEQEYLVDTSIKSVSVEDNYRQQ